MINKLSKRHSGDIEDYVNYTVKCPCCGTGLNFGKEDVYKDEDDFVKDFNFDFSSSEDDSISISKQLS